VKLLALVIVEWAWAGAGAGCAQADLECNFHSQCGDKHYCDGRQCRQDCQRNVDCTGGKECSEIGQCVPPGSGTDAGVPDGGPNLPDGALPDSAPQPGQGRYLDRCTAPGDCQSGLCVADVGGTMMCTRSCTGTNECANRQVCAGQRCVPDDTGRPCQITNPAACASGFCLGTATLPGACTRNCTQGADCPAGFACATVSAQRVCMEIEKPCASGEQCASGLCLTQQGCTSACSGPADCPPRLAGLPPYTCAIAFGSSTPICVPPADIFGPDAAGALCRPASQPGTTLCRSGACDDGAPGGPMCTQACNEAGGCPPGLGCFPLADAGSIKLVCSRAGTRSLGAVCANGRDCDSGLCDAGTLRCTRLCGDGICPTGWTCMPVAGFGVSICRL